MNWYALFVETGKESSIQKCIEHWFDKSVCYSLVPKRRLTEQKQGKKYQVVRTMFPGYVFINTDMCIEYYYKLISIPRVIKILNNGTYYSRIENEEIAPILRLVNNGEIIDYSRIFIVNSRVLVKSGPLHGMEGIIRRVDKRKGRAQISLDLLGSPKLFDLGVEILDELD